MQKITSGADVEGLAGFWQLPFGDETSEHITYDTPAEGEESVKTALEKLAGVGLADVTRALSLRVLRGLQVTLPLDDTIDARLRDGRDSGQVGKVSVRIAGEYFSVRALEDSGATIRLGQPDDYTKRANV